jgi:YD repeat-containing protein
MIEELYINDLSKMGIIGEVLSVKKEYYDLEGGDEQFDFLEETIIYDFDSYGNIIKETSEYANLIGLPPVVIKTDIEYNNKGQVIQKKSSNSREVLFIVQYSYNYNGNIISIRSLWGGSENLQRELRFLYNEQNQCVELTEYTRKAAPIDFLAIYEEKITLSYKKEFVYDNDGQLIKDDIYKNKDYIESFDYDNNNNWIVKNIHENGKNISKYVRYISYV